MKMVILKLSRIDMCGDASILRSKGGYELCVQDRAKSLMPRRMRLFLVEVVKPSRNALIRGV